MNSKHFLGIVAILAGLCGVSCGEMKIESSLSKTHVLAGESFEYEIRLINPERNLMVKPPEVPGVQVVGHNQGQRIEIVNFDKKVVVEHVYRMVAKKVGTYVFPSFRVKDGDREHTVGSLTLEVLSEAAADQRGVKRPVLTVSGLRDTVFEGEMIPVKIHLFLPEGMQAMMTHIPEIVGDAFLHEGFPVRPKKVEFVHKGQRGGGLEFETYVTAIKAGRHELQWNIGLNVQKPSKRRRTLLSMHVETQQMEVYTSPREVTVRAIPEHGQPENFSGAVGQFILGETKVDAETFRVGEPFTLKVPFVGRGNFSRVSAPDLEIGEGWKTYRPKTEFKQKDEFGYEGGKYFEYVLIPEREDLKETPVVRVSYLDPKTGRYEELESERLPIEIEASSVLEPVAEKGANAGSGGSVAKKRVQKTGVYALEVERGKGVESLMPDFFTVEKLAVHGGAGLALVVAFLVGRFRTKLRTNIPYATRRKSDKALSKSMHKLKKGFARRDPVLFYTAAQHAIAEALVHNHEQAEAMTMGEIDGILRERGYDQEIVGPIGEMFERADLIKFSGARSEDAVSREDLAQVEAIIKYIETWEQREKSTQA